MLMKKALVSRTASVGRDFTLNDCPQRSANQILGEDKVVLQTNVIMEIL